MLQGIRDLLRKVPFIPFRVHLADGRKLEIPHPDFAWLPKPRVFFYFHGDRNSSERIDPLLIVTVESANGAESE
jgi:hypothetical protein